MRVLETCCPGLWCRRFKSLQFFSLSCMIAGLLIYTGIGFALDNKIILSDRIARKVPPLLLSARFFTGIGGGLAYQHFYSSILRLTPLAVKPIQVTRMQFVAMIG